jgi:hypothetical protein
VGAATFFEGLDESGLGQGATKKPFWAVDRENEEELLRWLTAELDHLQEQAYERHQNQRKNLAVYRGIQYQSQDRRSRPENADESSVTRKVKNPRVVYNHMVDMVEQDVARLTKYRGAITARPATEDDSDRITARVAEKLVEGYWDKIEFDDLTRRHMRRRRIAGEDFITCLWDPSLGPYHSDYLRKVFEVNGIKEDPAALPPAELHRLLRRAKVRPKIPLVDPDSGEPLKGADGEDLWIEKPVRQGDVAYRLVSSWDMFLQRQEEYDQVEYGMYRTRELVDSVRAKHRSKAEKIKAEARSAYFDMDTFEETTNDGKVEVWHFYHKSTEELDSGWHVKFTRTAILLSSPNQYIGWHDQAILPWARTTDIDAPTVLNGDSTVTHGRAPQAVYNNIISLDLRNRFLFAHPKWFVQKGSVKLESLANRTTVVQHGGPAPVLSQPLMADVGAKDTRDTAKGDLQQIMGVYGVSRGDPPKGVTAAVAMTFLDEQETERANPGIAALSKTQKQLALQALWLMADHYEDDERRLRQLLGENMAATAKNFKMANLRNIADLRLQNSTALPQQKSARMQYILDIKKEFPGSVPEDTAIDLLGLGDVERLQSQVTVALRKAESENEGLMAGVPVEAPLEFEYHLGHYRIHRRQLNEVAFSDLKEETRAAFTDHVMAHEMFMTGIVERNPEYGLKITAEFPDFPVLYKPGQAAVAQMLAPPAPQTAAGGTGVSPGMSPESMPPVSALPAGDPENLSSGLETPMPSPDDMGALQTPMGV